MARFSATSAAALATAHPDLRRLFDEVVKSYDCTVLEGHRSKEAQDRAVAAGNSKTPWPTSKHNKLPSLAVDVAPYPVRWPGPSLSAAENLKRAARFYHFAGYVRRAAEELGIRIRWGGDWDGDLDVQDQTFDDLPHFELRGASPA